MLSKWQQQYGEWAVVTGASDGIGLDVAKLLAAKGMNLVLVARREPELQALASECAAVDVKICPADLSTAKGEKALLKMTESLEVGVLVAAAGYGALGDFLNTPLAEHRNMLALNAGSTLTLAHHYGQRMQASRKGALVLFSSVVAFQGTPYFAHYAATKAYVLSLAEGLAVELKPFGVNVLAVSPGPVATGFASRAAMKMHQSDHAGTVAKDIVAQIGQSTHVRPGWLGKILGYSMACLPRWAKVSMMARTMHRMLPSKNS
jgi:short-subunit dehydrogenase